MASGVQGGLPLGLQCTIKDKIEYTGGSVVWAKGAEQGVVFLQSNNQPPDLQRLLCSIFKQEIYFPAYVKDESYVQNG